jgi:Skp family chaperone for outer membrane proteins
MKKIVSLIIFLMVFCGSVHAADNIMFVDLERVFNDFYKTQLAKSKVQVQQDDIAAERQIMVDEMTVISDEVDVLKREARDLTLSEEIRDGKRLLYEERLIDLRAKQKAVEEFTARRTEQLQLQVSRMSQKIMDEIRQEVIEYAKQEGIRAVIDNSTRQAAVGIFLYTHPDVEITETILTRINSRRPDELKGDDLFEEDPAEISEEKPAE